MNNESVAQAEGHEEVGGAGMKYLKYNDGASDGF